MKMNERNIGRLMDVLQYAVEHYNQLFMDDDVRKAYPEVTKRYIDYLIDKDVISSTKDGNSFEDVNFEEYRSFLSELEDYIDDLDITEKEKDSFLSRLQVNLNINLVNADLGI